MICAHCGVRNPAGSEYCFNCGRDLSKFIAEPTASGRKSNRRNINQSSIQIADHFPRKGEPIANPELWIIPIPGFGVKVNDLSSCIARELTSRFSWTGFHSIIKRESLAKYYTADWGFYDTSSRWYALGFICLLRCALSKRWKELLPAPFDSEVYRATIRAMRSLWELSEEEESKADSFIGENLQSIIHSLGTMKDDKSQELWCKRYTKRFVGIGANSPWQISDDEKWGRSHMSEVEIYGENEVHSFEIDLWGKILISELYNRAFSAVFAAISQMNITNQEHDLELMQDSKENANAIATILVKCFNLELFMDVVGQYDNESDSFEHYFVADWTIDKSLTRWYSLALICLIHCSLSRTWTDKPIRPLGKAVQQATGEIMLERWGVTGAVKAQINLFVTQNIGEIVESLGTMEIPKYRKEWFDRYKARLLGRNPQWVIPEDGRSQLEDTLADEIKSGDDLRGLFQSINYLLKPECTLEPVLQLLATKGGR